MTADVLTIGETMAALRSRMPLRLGGQLTLSVAGAESNVAIALARLGHQVRWAGRVGDDELGSLVLRTLRAEGVDVTHATIGYREVTGMLLFEKAAAGSTRAHYRRHDSAASRLGPEDVHPALLGGARILHLTGITPALGDPPARAVRHALETARHAKMTVCMDVNYRAKLWPRHVASNTLRPLMRYVDILVASEDELSLTADGPDEAGRAAELAGHGISEVVVTRGSRGASVYADGDRLDTAAVAVPVVDTVGAGDAFTAGYLSGLLDGLPAGDRLDRAARLGAAAVTAEGDWEGLPMRADLDLLAERSEDALR